MEHSDKEDNYTVQTKWDGYLDPENIHVPLLPIRSGSQLKLAGVLGDSKQSIVGADNPERQEIIALKLTLGATCSGQACPRRLPPPSRGRSEVEAQPHSRAHRCCTPMERNVGCSRMGWG